MFDLQVHTPVLFVLMLFPLSAALIVFCISTLPITMSWPRNLTDLAEVGRELQGYTQSGPVAMAHVLAVISITAVFKHAWSIPGSVIWVRRFLTAVSRMCLSVPVERPGGRSDFTRLCHHPLHDAHYGWLGLC